MSKLDSYSSHAVDRCQGPSRIESSKNVNVGVSSAKFCMFRVPRTNIMVLKPRIPATIWFRVTGIFIISIQKYAFITVGWCEILK